MILFVTPDNRCFHGDLIDEHFQVREKIFNKRLGWRLESLNGREIDQFDQDYTYYALCYNEQIGIYGGARLLPTTKPHMFSEVFQKATPKSNYISDTTWEVSRLFVDTKKLMEDDPGIAKKAIYEVLYGLLKFCLDKKIQRLIALADPKVERIYRMCGWETTHIAPPIYIGGGLTVPIEFPIEKKYIEKLYEKGGHPDSYW